MTPQQLCDMAAAFIAQGALAKNEWRRILKDIGGPQRKPSPYNLTPEQRLAAGDALFGLWKAQLREAA